MANKTGVAKVLTKVSQEMFNEMVLGDGRQPAEVVSMVAYALADHFAERDPDFDRSAFLSAYDEAFTETI
jgi:hypothetical protein